MIRSKNLSWVYSPDQWEAFGDQALKDGYQADSFLRKAAFLLKEITALALYDRYRGRVMFPIHATFTGRVIAFGGRTPKNDKECAKICKLAGVGDLS